MHLTCVGMPKSKVDEALMKAYAAGCQNILALRGDLPRDLPADQANDPNRFHSTVELIQHIATHYPSFDIAVAGYPEGHPNDTSPKEALRHLKAKVDAGASFIITQMFYDSDRFLEWCHNVREIGVTVPIVPGIMPISTYNAFIRRASWCDSHIPQAWLKALEPIKHDDVLVRELGAQLVGDLCDRLRKAGYLHLHFYTMNLERSVAMLIERLGIEATVEQLNPLPWRKSLALKRDAESVRPIFWKNRISSYISRTSEWDEFPNGRWGDSRSPAFGEVDTYGLGLKVSNEQARNLWGIPIAVQDISNMFVRYCRGDLASLPWSDTPITAEVNSLVEHLVALNNAGLLTVNSQSAVDGESSSHPVFGWGPKGGFVYQKAYLEFFCPPHLLEPLLEILNADDELTFYIVNSQGNLRTNTLTDAPNAVTWGVYPGKEILQPTIVETISFLAWKDEAYRLGADWAACYEPNSPSRLLINNVMDTYHLVNVVHK